MPQVLKMATRGNVFKEIPLFSGIQTPVMINASSKELLDW